MAKKTDNRTHAQKRRQEAKDALRLKFQGAEYIRQLQVIYEDLTTLQHTVATASDDEAAPVIQKAECQVKILKAKADLNFRRLAKVLPDLKAVEITDDTGANPFGALADALKAAAGAQ